MQQTCSLYIANTQVLQIGECQMLEGNHENLFESGPYGSIWAHIRAESIRQGLGSLWDASRP